MCEKCDEIDTVDRYCRIQQRILDQQTSTVPSN